MFVAVAVFYPKRNFQSVFGSLDEQECDSAAIIREKGPHDVKLNEVKVLLMCCFVSFLGTFSGLFYSNKRNSAIMKTVLVCGPT